MITMWLTFEYNGVIWLNVRHLPSKYFLNIDLEYQYWAWQHSVAFPIYQGLKIGSNTFYFGAQNLSIQKISLYAEHFIIPRFFAIISKWYLVPAIDNSGLWFYFELICFLDRVWKWKLLTILSNHSQDPLCDENTKYES